MNNEKIFEEAVDVSIRLAKEKWGNAPAKGCLWLSNNGGIYSKKEFAPEGVKLYPSEERWHKELKKYIKLYIKLKT